MILIVSLETPGEEELSILYAVLDPAQVHVVWVGPGEPSVAAWAVDVGSPTGGVDAVLAHLGERGVFET
jgi:hypothetical protein